jgi:uncharacterized membrane protein
MKKFNLELSASLTPIKAFAAVLILFMLTSCSDADPTGGNKQRFDSLIENTYLFSVITAGVFILLAILISVLIPYQGGSQDKSYVKRRIWFFVLGFIAFSGFFIYNYFAVLDNIKNVAFQGKFRNCILVSVGVIIALYVFVSFLIMKFFPKSKFGSILK